ncbi:hypothetical protein FF1_027262 [Malus domestica]
MEGGGGNTQAGAILTFPENQMEGGGGNTRAGAILTFPENRGSLLEKLVVANLNGGTEEKRERGWMTEWQSKGEMEGNGKRDERERGETGRGKDGRDGKEG